MIAIAIISGAVIATLTHTLTEQKPKANTMQTVGVKDNSMSAEFDKAYMDGCTTDPSLKSYCQCTLDYFNSHYTYGKIMAIAGEYEDTGVYPDELYEASSACLDRL